MDKATLLAEVISQMKELKQNAAEASEGFLIPTDADEVRVEPCNDGAEDGTITSYRASVCCESRPQLFSDLRQAINSLQLEMVKVEISTLGNRVKNTFVFTCSKGENISIEECEGLASHVHQALTSVLDKAAPALPEYSPRTTLPSKRRRTSFFDTPSSSSWERRCNILYEWFCIICVDIDVSSRWELASSTYMHWLYLTSENCTSHGNNEAVVA